MYPQSGNSARPASPWPPEASPRRMWPERRGSFCRHLGRAGLTEAAVAAWREIPRNIIRRIVSFRNVPFRKFLKPTRDGRLGEPSLPSLPLLLRMLQQVEGRVLRLFG